MRLPRRSHVAALLLAAAFLPRPGASAADLHPLDPAAPAGVPPTHDNFEALVPLVDRESPVPSFAGEAPSAAAEGGDPADDMPVDLTGMDHGATGHGAPAAEAPE